MSTLLNWDEIWADFDEAIEKRLSSAKRCDKCGEKEHSDAYDWEFQQKVIEKIVDRYVRMLLY